MKFSFKSENLVGDYFELKFEVLSEYIKQNKKIWLEVFWYWNKKS